ncbi:MAG: hypothetical protein OIF35_08480 [Cellvibrionaceae bacterium]|nr:hypothetical protein [Cellvibrionaceae bacterium]MCV6626932.1 hypothetical protein [Cellvibrionaceae bacterium]
MASQLPIIGDWYNDLAMGQIFEVVAIDDQASTIEIQYVDGGLSEYDYESWGQLAIGPAEAPEDASAGYEMSQEDSYLGDEIMVPNSGTDPLGSIEPESFADFDDF